MDQLASCGLLFGTGAAGAFGPCGAQRTLGLFACTAGRRAKGTVFLYGSGIVVATTALVVSTMLVRNLVAATPFTTLALACICVLAGIAGLWNAGESACSHVKMPQLSGTGAFTVGFGSSLLIAPCCSPFLFLIGATAPERYLGVDALAYALGSAAPYLCVGLFARRIAKRVVQAPVQQACRIVSASLTLALGLVCLAETTA